ncbi:site-specific integrase, partial [Methanocalculus sp.]|uniref:site-specific integrase n=1 Tax=Methanocalculus sp. TaxID=2004547 RepID=UPI002605B1CB
MIREFIADSQSCNNIGISRIHKLTYTLVGWRRFIGPYAENTNADITRAILTLRNAKHARGRPFAKNTVRDHITILKQFYYWLIENGYTEIDERKLKRVKTPPCDAMTKTASDILTPEEVTAMVNACTRSVDRATIMMLYEGGFRIGELAQMAWGDLVADKYGYVVNVDFKTGKPRYIRLIMAAQHISSWKADYPFEPAADSLVFITRYKTPLTHHSIEKQLQRIAGYAGIEKHITPHIFRHSRITHLIKDGVSESVIKLMMWGTINTPMFQTYAHLAGKDIDIEMLRSYGIATTEEDAPTRLEPRQCKNCHTINAPTSSFCSTCGFSLTEDAAATIEDAKQDIASDPDVMQAIFDQMFEKK